MSSWGRQLAEALVDRQRAEEAVIEAAVIPVPEGVLDMRCQTYRVADARVREILERE